MIKRVFQKPHIFFVLGIFLIYLLINFFASGFYKTIKLVLIYAQTVNWVELSISLLLTILIGLLVAVNAVMAFVKYRERKKCRKGIAAAGVGSVGGLIVGVCPLCVTGIFPLIFGLFGIGFSFASLPFNGIEIQILVVIILLISLRMLRKNE